jgi:hypothetical protein
MRGWPLAAALVMLAKATVTVGGSAANAKKSLHCASSVHTIANNMHVLRPSARKGPPHAVFRLCCRRVRRPHPHARNT